MNRETCTFGARKYDLLVPKNHNKTILFCLHGWGQKLKNTRPKLFDFPGMTKFDELCNERGYILVYPHARGFLPSWSFKDKKDINFCCMLMSTLSLHYSIKKIFGCGFSQGGVLIQAIEEVSILNFDGIIVHSSGSLEEGLEVYKSKIKIERANHSGKRHPKNVIGVLGDKDKILGKKGLTRLDDIINRYAKRGCKTHEYYLNNIGHEWDATKNNEYFDILES